MADPRNKPIWRVHTIDTPVAGAEFSITPNTAASWLIRTIAFTLVTDATVADRVVSLTASETTIPYVRFVAEIEIPASTTSNLSAFYGGAGAFGDLTSINIPFPTDGIWLPQGHSLRSSTVGIAAADQYSAIRAFVIEFPSGPQEHFWPFVPTLLEDAS